MAKVNRAEALLMVISKMDLVMAAKAKTEKALIDVRHTHNKFMRLISMETAKAEEVEEMRAKTVATYEAYLDLELEEVRITQKATKEIDQLNQDIERGGCF